MRNRSRLIVKLNRRQLHVSLLVYTIMIVVFLGCMLPSIYRVSGESIETINQIISDEIYALVKDFQTYYNTFVHSSEVQSYLKEYVTSSDEGVAARIAIKAQEAKSLDFEILNICVDDHCGNLISSLNYSDVQRELILNTMPGYLELRDSREKSYLSSVQRGVYLDKAGDELPYVIYARNLNVGENNYTISIFYDVTYFLSRLNNICKGTIDGYCLFDKYGGKLFESNGFPQREDMYERMMQQGKLTVQHMSVSGYYRFNRLNEMGIGIMIYASYLTMFSELLPSLLLVVLVLLLLPLVTTIGLARINRAVLQPLTELSDELRSYYPGKHSKFHLDTNDEISDLCDDFSRMMTKVNQQVEDIQQQERDNAVTQYRLLATQIDPHFIYNTMSLINALASEGDYQGVLRVNTALMRLLRERLNTKATIMDTVRHEIETLNEYLHIMEYRYGNAVQVQMDVDVCLLDAQIPKNLLQPLIENSFFHGLTKPNGECGGSISVMIYEMEQRITIEISDDGKGMPADYVEKLNRGEENTDGSGNVHIGFDNIRQRLKYIYREDFNLQVYSVEGRGSTVAIELPIHR